MDKTETPGSTVLPFAENESLGALYPDLSKQWHPTKNGKLTPFMVAKRSNKNVWWQCPENLDHVYQQVIDKRSAVGVGCPYCSGKRLTKERSLATVDPKLAREWHPTKNKDQTPETIFANSNKKFWWQCDKEPRHEWKTTPSSRRGSPRKGCPYCANQLVHETNSFLNLNPIVAKEWHPTKNGKNLPDQFVAGSAKKIWWLCPKDKNHVWQVAIRNRVAGSGCPFCTKQTSSPEIRIYAELQFIFNIVENRCKIKGYEADIFLPECHTVIEYDGAHWHHHKEAKDKGKNKHFEKLGFNVLRVREQPLGKLDKQDISVSPKHFLKSDIDQLMQNLKSHCAAEMQEKIQDYVDSENFMNNELYNKYLSYFPSPFPEKALAKTQPKLAKEWDYTANFPLTPSNFTSGSNKKVWWICRKNASHKWQATIKGRSIGKGCHFCSNHKPSEENNLQEKYPELLEFWHPTKNLGILPSSLSPRSNKKVWWKCPIGSDHEWKASVNGRMQHGKPSGCPFCANKRISSTNNLKILRADLAEEWDQAKNAPLAPEKVTPGSQKSVWWICKLNRSHTWKTRISHRNNGSGCPYCSGRKK